MIEDLVVDQSTNELVVRLSEEGSLTINNLEVLVSALSYFSGLGVVFYGDDFQALSCADISCLLGALSTVQGVPLVLRIGRLPVDRSLLFWFARLEGLCGSCYAVPDWVQESRSFYGSR